MALHKNARLTLRNLRLGFAATALLLVAFALGFAWRSWEVEKEYEFKHLASIVEITGNSLSAYFDHYEQELSVLAEDIPAISNAEGFRQAHQAMQRFRAANPELARITLSAPDGQMLLADDTPPGAPLPDRNRNMQTFAEAVRQLESGKRFHISRATRSVFDGEWILPMRYGIRDASGRLRHVLGAALLISRQQALWHNVPLPPNSALGLIRDDAYMVSRYPVPTKMNYDELYGKPRDGRLVEYLRETGFPARGTTQGMNSVAKAEYLFAFHRLAHYPMTVFVSTPVANLQQKWLNQAQFAFWLLLFLLGGGYAAFRWAKRRQLAWEGERAAAEAKIEFIAEHDPLTRLPNRLLAQDRLQQAFAYADRANAKVAVLFLDLDNFKAVNDSLGHSIGDGLLQTVATRLGDGIRDTDTLARLGGDEFLVILADVHDADSVSRIAESVVARLVEPCDIEGHELSTTASIGIALYPDDGRDFETLLKKADTAMYYAKEAGRNTHRFFAESMNVQADEGLRMRAWLREAIEQDGFEVHYQPQIDIATGAVIGAEALVRLRRGAELIAPARFIGIAEASGLIVPIGARVLRAACQEAAGWRRAGHEDIVVAINLSAIQFRRGDLEQTVGDALAAARLPPTSLELELTESMLIDASDAVRDTIRRLQAIGVRFSIDDFGTGYSSLAYLKRFNVDKLKIDQSFVRDIVADPDDAAIVTAVIQMAHSLGMKTIAEGVETEAVLADLRQRQCDEAQGYLYARPMPADEFARYLQTQSEPAARPDNVLTWPRGPSR